MSDLADYAYAARFRDAVRTIADGEIDSLRPKYNYGKVLDIDVVGRKALVVDNGDVDDNAVWRPYGAIAPRAIGQYVRIEGLSGDRFIADVMGEGNLTDPDTIPPPANLALSTTVDYTLPQVTVTWQAPTSTDPFGYQVRWKPASGTNWQYRFVQAPTTSTMLYPLAKDTTYTVEVATIGRSGGVSAGTVGTITTGHDTTAPSAPTGLTVIAGFEVLEISWNDNSELDVKFGAGTYRVQVSTNAGFTAVIRNFVVGGTKTTVSGLADSTTYYVRIYARDADGNESLASGSVSTTTNAPIVPALTDGVAPSTSPTPSVTGGYGFLAVLWTPITNADPVMYEVHMSTVSGFTPDRTGTTTKYGEVSGTGMIVKKLPNGTALVFGTTYYFKIIAKDADGKGPDSAQGSGQMQQITSGDQVIANAAITNAQIANVTADKIQSGTMTAQTFTVGAGGSIQSSGFVSGAGGAGWKITDTTAEFHGTVYATSGSFSGDLQVSTIKGWLTLDVASGGGFRTTATGNRIEISGNRAINFFTGDSHEVTNGFLQVSPQVAGTSYYGELDMASPGYGQHRAELHLKSESHDAIPTRRAIAELYAQQAQILSWGFGNYVLADSVADWVFIQTGANGLTIQGGGAVKITQSLQDGSGRTIIDGGGGWHRTYGATGWYNNDYGGGMYMSDTTWVRTYGGKQFYCDSVIRADTRYEGSGGGPPVLVSPVWTNVTFMNTWSNYGGIFTGVQYCKDAQGFVQLRGLAKSGDASLAAFQLPVGFRPSGELVFMCPANNGVFRMHVRTDGVVIWASTYGSGVTGDFISFNMMRFHAS